MSERKVVVTLEAGDLLDVIAERRDEIVTQVSCSKPPPWVTARGMQVGAVRAFDCLVALLEGREWEPAEDEARALARALAEPEPSP